ncbi:MAG: radical SAM/SPASM domain-containing protein [Vulcanibacillus sp.]
MIKFKKVYIEITNVCNLTCSFCPPTKRASANMTIDEFTNILDSIKEHSNYLYFHVKGEPLLHPDLNQFLRISYNKGFKVNLTTNGTLIQQRGKILLSNPAIRQISFSLQSFEKHQDLSKRDKYISDILEFTKEAINQTDIIIEIRLWNLDSNGNTEKTDKNAYFLGAIEKLLNLPYKIEEKINRNKGTKIAERIYLSQSFEFEWPNLAKKDISERGFCYGLRNQIAILVDGTVVPCCLDSEGDINLGNIHDTEFINIIEGERAINIVKGFSNRKVVEQLCKKCGYRNRFE